MSTVPAGVDARVEATAAERARRLFDAHARSVVALCRAMLCDVDEAEDAAQQAFVSACRALKAGARPRDEGAWIAAIARNECRSRIRDRMAQPTRVSLNPDAHAAPVGVADAVELAADLDDLQAAIRELPPRERTAVALRELCGLRYDEVAEAMGIRSSSVEPLLWRARRRLRARLRS